MKKPYPVLVEWIDAHGVYAEWSDPKEDKDDKPAVIKTVGWLMPKQKKDHIVVVLNLGDDYVADGIAIPKSLVQSVTRLL